MFSGIYFFGNLRVRTPALVKFHIAVGILPFYGRCHFPDGFMKKKIRSFSFRTQISDLVADKKAEKMGDFLQRHLGGLSGVLL
jgi:hypothetical protein